MTHAILKEIKDVIEAWRPVVGFEGLYEVSDLGRACDRSGAANSAFSRRPRTRATRGYGSVVAKMTADGHSSMCSYSKPLSARARRVTKLVTRIMCAMMSALRI